MKTQPFLSPSLVNARLSAPLKDVRCDGNPLLTLHNPLTLQNWTYPAIEGLLIVGAVACLVHAARWYRQHRDASNLVVWISLISALLLIEPMAYFPQWFGMDRVMGLTFVHGQFSVQFFYDRLPLYIVAMYSVFGYVAYTLVQRTGILKTYNAFVGAVCVAFVFWCLFEVIDTVGPQWRWWVWNTELPTSKPSLGPIPYLSLQMFSVALPFGIAFAARLVSKTPHPGGWYIVRDVVMVSVGRAGRLLPLGVRCHVFDLRRGALGRRTARIPRRCQRDHGFGKPHRIFFRRGDHLLAVDSAATRRLRRERLGLPKDRTVATVGRCCVTRPLRAAGAPVQDAVDERRRARGGSEARSPSIARAICG
jgi:hypothetical protein